MAFLVNPYNKNQVLKAIEISSFLWGSVYNPIIPVPKKIPKNWKKNLFRESLKNVIEGYIEAYDPDMIVEFEDNVSNRFNLNGRKAINANQILKNLHSRFTNLGISIYGVLEQIYIDEFKFLKKNPQQFNFPEFSKTYEIFFSAVFGKLNYEQFQNFKNYFKNDLDINTKKCDLSNFSTFLDNQNIFLRRITDSYIKHVRNIAAFDKDFVIVINANSSLDILDYWNLRAAGLSILPLPIQSDVSDDTYKTVLSFINSNYYAINQNNVYNTTRILKGQSLNETEFDIVVENINKGVKNNNMILLQSWFPSIWNNLYRRYDHIGYCDTHSESKEIEISNQNTSLSLETIYPKFSRQSYTDLGQYINEIEINLTSTGSDLLAKAIPEAGEELYKAFGVGGYKKWRFSKNGIFHLSEHKKDNLYFRIPTSEKIFESWFKSKNIEIRLSNSGHVATQIIKRLGSVDNLRGLVNEEIIKLLIKFSKDSSELEDNNKTISFNELLEISNKAQHKDGFLWKASDIFNSLINDNILQLGIRLQCTICRQYFWYSLKAINYNLNCPNCLSDFPFPSTTPNKLSWRYKPVGPFSLGKEHIGVYCTLLCLTFFQRHLSHTPLTTMLSFDIIAEGLEIDLSMIISRGYKSSGHQEVLFFECKSYNEFERKDIKRMEYMANNFPGAIIVFATLKRELSQREKKLLSPFVKKCRKYYKNDQPVNPVLILTGNELFAAWSPPTCWKDLGEKYDKFKESRINIYSDLFEFCDVTQQLYLGLESWHELIRKKFKLGS